MNGYMVRRADAFELLLDDTNGRGRVVVVSIEEDRAWTYCWPATNRGGGADFATWLAGCDLDYVARKMRAADWFDADHTVEAVRDDIIRARRDGRIDKGDARQAWDSLDDIRTEADWVQWVNDHPDLYEYVWETRTTGIEPEFRRAFAALWPDWAGRQAARSARLQVPA